MTPEEIAELNWPDPVPAAMTANSCDASVTRKIPRNQRIPPPLPAVSGARPDNGTLKYNPRFARIADSERINGKKGATMRSPHTQRHALPLPRPRQGRPLQISRGNVDRPADVGRPAALRRGGTAPLGSLAGGEPQTLRPEYLASARTPPQKALQGSASPAAGSRAERNDPLASGADPVNRCQQAKQRHASAGHTSNTTCRRTAAKPIYRGTHRTSSHASAPAGRAERTRERPRQGIERALRKQATAAVPLRIQVASTISAPVRTRVMGTYATGKEQSCRTPDRAKSSDHVSSVHVRL